MNSIKSIGIMAVGAGLAIGGGINAFDAAGVTPDIRLVYGWSMIVVFGLYLVGWGLIKYAMSAESRRRRARPSPSPKTDFSAPSAHSRTTRRHRNRRPSVDETE